MPFKQAIKLPLYVYGRAEFRRMKGKIILDTPNIHSGMVKIGKRDYYVATAVQKCIWTISGTLIIHGPIKFMQGSYLLVADNGTLEIGGLDGIFGTNIRIFCFDRITIGRNVRMAWDIQIMDSSFHYIELTHKDNQVTPLTKPIVLGDNIWVGNRTTISKGAVIPNQTVIASNSLINKDFSNIEPVSKCWLLAMGVSRTAHSTSLKPLEPSASLKSSFSQTDPSAHSRSARQMPTAL